MTSGSAPSNNAAIAAGLRSGDRNMIETLFLRHGDMIFRYLLANTRSRPDAEDLAQETWVRVLEHGAQYRGELAFEAWLLAIARNLLVDRARRTRKRPSVSLDDGSLQTEAFCRSSAPSPYETFRSGENAARLGTALRRLPERIRAVIRLRFEFELPLAQVAARLNLVPVTVRTQLHRAILGLRSEVMAAATAGSSCAG